MQGTCHCCHHYQPSPFCPPQNHSFGASRFCDIMGCNRVASLCTFHAHQTAPLGRFRESSSTLNGYNFNNVPTDRHTDMLTYQSSEERNKKKGNGCKKSGCNKRKFTNEEVCIDHARPSTCIVSNCADTVTPGNGVCTSHFAANIETRNLAPQELQQIQPIVSELPQETSTCKSTRCKRPRVINNECCDKHLSRRFCKQEGCSNLAHGKGLCKAHGGVRVCSVEGCSTGARGKTKLCVAHGGGKRCSMSSCDSGAVSSSGLCRKHGGGKRCKIISCSSAASGGTDFCKTHGGGKRCVAEQCGKPAHNKNFCYKHYRLAGFNPLEHGTCSIKECNKKSFRNFDTCKYHSRLEDEEDEINLGG